ncbi:hypothetical protein ABK040_000870 [Willaertia magna]
MEEMKKSETFINFYGGWKEDKLNYMANNGFKLLQFMVGSENVNRKNSLGKYDGYESTEDESSENESSEDVKVIMFYNEQFVQYEDRSWREEEAQEDLWDEDYILKSLQKFVDIFPFINSTILCNSEFISKAIKANGEMAIESNHDAYCHLNEQDKLDKEYLTLAIKNHNYLFRSKVLKSIPNEMFNEMDIALTILRVDPFYTIQSAKLLLKNKETALVLVKHSPYVIRWLEVNLRNDEEIIIESIKTHFDALRHVKEKEKYLPLAKESIEKIITKRKTFINCF